MPHELPFGLTWADYAIIAILGVSVIISLIRGFVREALSLGSWIAAFFVAFKFYEKLAVVLSPYISTPSLRVISSFVVLLIITLVLGGLLNFLISRIVTSTGLSGTDKSLGMIFGFARGILLIGLVILLLSSTAFSQDEWWKKSLLIPQFQPMAVWLKGFLPDKMNQLSGFVAKQKTDAEKIVAAPASAPLSDPAVNQGSPTVAPVAAPVIVPVVPPSPTPVPQTENKVSEGAAMVSSLPTVPSSEPIMPTIQKTEQPEANANTTKPPKSAHKVSGVPSPKRHAPAASAAAKKERDHDHFLILED